MARTARVDFSPGANRHRRAAREDEISVMRAFARHASRCDACYHPYHTYRAGKSLCPTGIDYARDVSKYIYVKGGIPHAMIERFSDGNQRVEVEIPTEFEVVRELMKAFDRGMSLKQKSSRTGGSGSSGRREKPIVEVSHDKNYYVGSRGQRPEYIEITPSSRRERDPKRYHGGSGDKRGSLYIVDEEAAKRSGRYRDDPVVIIAEPGRRYHR